MIFHAMLALVVGIVVQDILYLMMFGLSLPISAGIVKLLRFIWWRVNGWGEFAAQITGLIMVTIMLSPIGNPLVVWAMSLFGGEGNDAFFVTRQMMLISASSIVSILVILCTKPEPMDMLAEFYKRIRPYGWWGPVIKVTGERHRNRESRTLLWLMTFTFISTTFSLIAAAIGIFLAFPGMLIPGCIIFIISITVLLKCVNRLYPNGGDSEQVAEESA
jgi:hypothetical protein